MIIVTGTAVARPDSIDALRDASIAHVHRSRTEDGCISHSVQIDCENPLRLVFFERWRDMAALQVHFAQAGSRTFLEAMKLYAAEPGTLDLYEATPVPR